MSGSGGMSGDGGGGHQEWVENVGAGVTDVDKLAASIAVPPLPLRPNDGQTDFLWPGLELSNGDILQPMIIYQTNDYDSACPNGTYCYEVNAFYYPVSSGRLVYASPAYLASVGDAVNVASWMVSSSEWELEADDTTNSNRAYAYVDETWSSPNYDGVQGAVMEVVNASYCEDMPHEFVYNDIHVYQGTTAWNSFNEITSSVSLAPNNDWVSGQGIPDCAYDGGYVDNSGAYGAWISWCGTVTQGCSTTSDCCSWGGTECQVVSGTGTCVYPPGHSCTADSQCFSPGVCNPSNDRCYIENGGICSSNGQCISNRCSSGVCVCDSRGQSCIGAAGCCPGLICNGGTCQTG